MAMAEAKENYSLIRLEDRMIKHLEVLKQVEAKAFQLEDVTINRKADAESGKEEAVSGYTLQRLHIHVSSIQETGERILKILARTYARLEEDKD